MKRTNSLFLTLDIETSIEMGDDGKPSHVWLSYGVCQLWTTKGERISNTRFRTWDEYSRICEKTCQWLGDREVNCYVHNLSYEFDFLIKNLHSPAKVLCNSTHTVISGYLFRYPNIVYKCTYQYTGKPLKVLGEMINLPKLESEYRTIRPDEPVTEEEWVYCERDNEIVAQYIIKVALAEYNSLSEIPLTKTGRVRKLKNKLYDDFGEKSSNWDEMPPLETIEALDGAFNGGITISNPFFTDALMNDIDCYDICSSYPYCAISEVYPRKISKHVGGIDLDSLAENMWIAKLMFINIESKYPWCWLSCTKMTITYGCEWFNGKLVRGEAITRYVTSIDYDMICKTYTFDEVRVIEMYDCTDIQPLPNSLLTLIEMIGEKKERLKKEFSALPFEITPEYISLNAEYNSAKSDFNSIYGMLVEKLIKEEYTIDERFNWSVTKGHYKYSPHIKRNFLFGVFITAYARRNLLTAIIANCPYTFVYADTDSIKYIKGTRKFNDTNKPIFDRFQSGKLAKLGRFEFDGHYDEFKTLGAKKYIRRQGDVIMMTVAGLPKNNKYNITPTQFKSGILFENCKLAKRYIWEGGVLDEVEGVKDKEIDVMYGEGGVALYPTSYYLDMTESDKNYIAECKANIDMYSQLCKEKEGVDINEHIEKSGCN